MFRTPKNRATVLGLALFLFLTAPAVVAWYFWVELDRGSYSVAADSIGIPIFGFVAFWGVTSPLTWGVVWFCVRRYPGAILLAVWNSGRPMWSMIWTALMGGAASMFVLTGASEEVTHHPLLIAHIALDVYFLLVLRSAIVSQNRVGQLPVAT